MSVAQFKPYLTTNCSYDECSTYKNVPIQLLTAFRETFGSTMRIRYRGNRIEFKRLDGRTNSQCYQDCIKARGTTFSAYVSDYKRYITIIEREQKMSNQSSGYENFIVTIDGEAYIHASKVNTNQINDLEYKLATLKDKLADTEQELMSALSRVDDLETVLYDIAHQAKYAL